MGSSEYLEEEFQNSVEKIDNCGKTFDNDTMLKLYGYYKQAKFGDCDSPSPNFWQIKEKAKWDAWVQHKGMTREHAMKRYIKYVCKLLE
jgi:diazepam-binding inhibitor (GABA receptor modulating acyl-CoA-binding protein)